MQFSNPLTPGDAQAFDYENNFLTYRMKLQTLEFKSTAKLLLFRKMFTQNWMFRGNFVHIFAISNP